MVINEWIQIAVMAWCLVLFAAGGTHIDGIGGQKWLRRFLMPIGLGALALLYAPWWASLGYSLSLCLVLHLGYGSKASWLYRAIIFIGYGAVSLWFGWSWWTVIVPIVCLVLFALSNFQPTAKVFPWKYIEALFGLLIAFAYLAAF